jgi:hypothetical protein
MASEKPIKRVILRIDVTAGTPQRLDDAVQSFLSTHVSVVSRLVDWFITQDDEVQATVLRLMPHGHECDPAHRALERMMRKPRTSSVPRHD